MIDVFTEDDRLGEGIGCLEQLHDPPGYQFRALVEDEDAVHVLLVEGAVFDLLPEVVPHPRRRCPSVDVFVDIDTDHFIGGEEAVLDALLQTVGVNGLAEVVDIGDVLRFLGRRRHAELNGAGKIIEDLPPGGIIGGAAPVALVDDDHVEEIRGDVPEYLVCLVLSRNRLIESQVDFIGRVDLPVLHLGHHRSERLEVVDQGLIRQDVAIDQE